MVKNRVLFALTVLLLAACDPVYGPPSVRNSYDTDIDFNVDFADGAHNQFVLPPCSGVALGGIGNTGKMNVAIQRVLIRKGGQVIHDLNADQILALAFMNKEQSYRGYSVWSIGPDGIRFETNPDSKECPRKTNQSQ